MRKEPEYKDYCTCGDAKESETANLPLLETDACYDALSDYELIKMYQDNRDDQAIISLVARYEGMAVGQLGRMKDAMEYNDRKQTAFMVAIEVVAKIKLNKINPNNYTRCFYLWYKQGIYQAMRDYKSQLGGLEDITKCEYDETIHVAHNHDITGAAMEKMAIWDLLTEDEAYVVELYISGIPLAKEMKKTSLYRLLNSAKAKIAEHYGENGIILNI